jgi:hypothetical protein
MLLLNKEIYTHLLNIFFVKLKTEIERQSFLYIIKDDTLKKIINDISDLFVKYPFYDDEIIFYAEKNEYFIEIRNASSRGNIKMITNLQRKFYLNIYDEYMNHKDKKHAPEVRLHYTLLNQKNRSYNFLLNFMENNDLFGNYFLDMSIISESKKSNKKTDFKNIDKENVDIYLQKILQNTYRVPDRNSEEI